MPAELKVWVADKLCPERSILNILYSPRPLALEVVLLEEPSLLLHRKPLRNPEAVPLLFFCSFNMNKDCVSGLGNARTLHNENASRFVSDILLGPEKNFNFYFTGKIHRDLF